jgi:hypothetical protein
MAMSLQGANTAETNGQLTAPNYKDLEHYVLDGRLREYARRRSALDAAESFDLVRAEQLKIYAVQGFATHYEYMERRLGYVPHTARERMRVARALVALPETSAALASGALTYSAVRELTRVATAETERDWLAAAKGLVTNQIENLVANHRPGDHPDDPTDPDLRPRVVRLELPPEIFALWRQARLVIATERGAEVSDADLVESLCRSVISPGSGAAGPPHQIAYKRCTDCRRVTQNGAGREIDVAPAVFERASCDARDLGNLDAPAPERATTTVTPRVREQVFARDQNSCRVPGCRSARNLEVHHIIEQSQGGCHELWNIALLCSGHHTAIHTGMLTMHGRAPGSLQFRWTCRAPIPIGLTSEQRERFCRQQDAELQELPLPILPPEGVDELVFEWDRRHSKSQLGRHVKRRPLPPVRPAGMNDVVSRPGREAPA